MRKLLLASLLLTTTISAQPYDALVAGIEYSQSPPSSSEVVARGNSGEMADISAVAAGPDGRVFAAVEGTPYELIEMRPIGQRTVGPFPPGWSPDVMTIDRAGNVYTLASGAFNDVALIAMNAKGEVRAIYSMLQYIYAFDTPRAMDLAADQCTLYFAGTGRIIRRFDVCNGVILPDFATVALNQIFDLRVLPDGGLLVSGPGAMARVDANGASNGRVDVHASPVAMALTHGGTRVMFAGEPCDPHNAQSCTGSPDPDMLTLFELDLASENETNVGPVYVDFPESIAPYFSWTAALGDAHPSRRRASRK